ncbi:hypothetical protein C8J57DRAFT_1556116 [Mycena rebaudengoi]|nr:hypothetical protein C8J57DRAFT_1556116 [Mycena rebaudengoi]
MPPKAKLREDDFHYSEDRSHVQCKACGSSKWIAVKSAAKHLTSVEHLKTVELGEEARKRREELEKERQTDSATTELRSIQFAASRLPSGPIGSTSSGLHARSEAEVEMWEAYESTGAAFSAGEDPDDTHIHHKRLREEVESFGVQNPEAAARNLGFGDGDVAAEMLAEDEEEDFLSEIMRNAGIEDPNPEEIQADGSARSGSDPKWFPYPSKLMFLLDTLSNLPRLRISSSLMRVFLWVLKEAGCKDVPSFDHLRRVQKSLRADCGVPTIPCKSVQGNVFFMNDPAAIIAQDWANPTIRKLIHVFPEIPKDGIIREIWHAQKWRKNMDLDMLSPMYDSRGSHYYVNEVSRLKNGNFVIPIRWVICNDKVHADVFSISFNDQGEATVLDEGTSLVCSEEFVENYLDLLHVRKIPKWAAGSIEAGHSARMPNLKRALAAGDPLYCSFVDYFGDDVSGNRTKSWNKHWNAYMTHRNLPRECLQQEFHTHFISTSPNASVTEQFNEFKSRVEYGYLVYFVPTNLTAAHNRATHVEPVKVRDESGGTTRFCIHVNAGPSDNPMQSEISGHIGGKALRLDLGNPSPNNFLLNTSVIPATLFPSFPGAPGLADNRSRLYAALTGNPLEQSYNITKLLPLSAPGPAVQDIVYLCRFQRAKSPSKGFISVLVATLSMFSSGWALYVAVAESVVKMRDREGNICAREPRSRSRKITHLFVAFKLDRTLLDIIWTFNINTIYCAFNFSDLQNQPTGKSRLVTPWLSVSTFSMP